MYCSGGVYSVRHGTAHYTQSSVSKSKCGVKSSVEKSECGVEPTIMIGDSATVIRVTQ